MGGKRDFHEEAIKIMARAGWKRCDARGFQDPHQNDADDRQAAGGVFLSPDAKTRFVHPLNEFRRATIYKGGVRFFVIKNGIIVADERIDIEDEEAIDEKAKEML